jgi:hypothetical protein
MGRCSFVSVVILIAGLGKSMPAKPAMEAGVSEQLWFLDEMTALL